jgi:PKD repeat protein
MKPSRIAKRLIVPVLLAATLVAAAVVFAQPPVAGFDVAGPTGNTCGLYNFASSSTDEDNDIASWTWSLAGTPASGPSAQATFGTPGTRSVTLTVKDAAGGDDTTEDEASITKSVDVVNDGPPNAAIATTPANPVQSNTPVTVSAQGSADTGNGSIAKYEFDLNGDNVFETNNGTNTATVTFAAGDPPSHTVRVRVTDNCGVPDTAVTSVLVQNTPPTASFTFTPNPAAIGLPVTFNAAGSSADTTKYEWSFDGDDTTFEVDGGAVATTTHTFPAPGFYLVYLRVSDAEGATNVTNRLVRVNAKPSPSFVATPNPALIGEAVSFDPGTSSDSDGTIATYQWDLDGDGTFEATQTTATPVTHTYNATATVDAKLRVTDNNGAVADFTRQVVVQATRPSAGFSYAPHDPLPGQAVTLTSTSAPSASPSAPSLVATQWDFGYSPVADFTLDGAGGSIVTSFANPGPHTVAVKVTETGGGFAIATDTINVNAAPQAGFTVSPSKPAEGKEVTFASTSGDPDGPLVKQEWDLNNDGKYEKTGTVATTTKLKKGPRRIALRVTDSKGAQATSTQVLTVKGPVLRNPQDLGSTLSYLRHSWGVAVVGFTIKTPAQTSVAVSCKGRGCPHGTFHKRTRKKAATLGFPKLTGSLRAGAKVNILFTKTGRITGWDVYTVGHGKTVLREGCKIGRAKKQKRCP